LAELETQILIAQKLGFLEGRRAAQVLERIDEVNRILAGLIGSLKLSP